MSGGEVGSSCRALRAFSAIGREGSTTADERACAAGVTDVDKFRIA